MKHTCDTCAYLVGRDMHGRPVCGRRGTALADGIYFMSVVIEPSDCEEWERGDD